MASGEACWALGSPGLLPGQGQALEWGRCPLTGAHLPRSILPRNAASRAIYGVITIQRHGFFLIQFAFWGKLITSLLSPLNLGQSCLLVAGVGPVESCGRTGPHVPGP